MADDPRWALRYPDTTLSLLGFLLGFAIGASRAGAAVGLVTGIIGGAFTAVLSHRMGLEPSEGPQQ